jgi:arylsulfatase A-like enzyme
LILADDMGYGEIQALNPQRGKIPTPHLDQLIESGLTFTDAHSASSVCTPSRYALLTGRYCWRTRLQKGVLTGNGDPLIAADRPTVQAMLQRSGYQTAVIGKWHLNYNYEGHHPKRKHADKSSSLLVGPAPIGTRILNGPTTRGFDQYFGFHHSREMSSLCEDDRIVEEIPVIDMLPRLTKRAVDHIERQSNQPGPFFLYLALNSPHTPIVPGPEWIGKSGLGPYGDFVMQTDATVGKVVRAIDQSGQNENTIVIFSCDNGTSRAAGIKELQQQGHYPSAHFRGSKADLWEGGHRVPLIVRWPAGSVKPGTRNDSLICLADFYATAAELVGVKVPAHAAVDSISFLPALSGRRISRPRVNAVHHSSSGHFAIRQGQWKLNLARGSGGWSSPNEKQAKKLGLPIQQVYDMEADPSETTNLIHSKPKIASELNDTLSDVVDRGRTTRGTKQPNAVIVDIRKSK